MVRWEGGLTSWPHRGETVDGSKMGILCRGRWIFGRKRAVVGGTVFVDGATAAVEGRWGGRGSEVCLDEI